MILGVEAMILGVVAMILGVEPRWSLVQEVLLVQAMMA